MKKSIKLSIGLTTIAVCSVAFIGYASHFTHTIVTKQVHASIQNVPASNQVSNTHFKIDTPMTLKELSVLLMKKYADGYSCIYPIELIDTNNNFFYKKSSNSSTFLFTNKAFTNKPCSEDLIISFTSNSDDFEFVISSFDYNNLVLITKGYITSKGKISKYY